METLIDWIEDELKSRGWKPADLARAAGITDGTLSRILSGARGAGPDVCARLADAFDVPPEQVLRLAGQLPPTSPEVMEEEEAIHLLRSLSRQARSYALTILRALRGRSTSPASVEPRESSNDGDGNGDRDRPRTIKERLAWQLAKDLEQLSPEDQQRVFDLLDRLSGGAPRQHQNITHVESKSP